LSEIASSSGSWSSPVSVATRSRSPEHSASRSAAVARASAASSRSSAASAAVNATSTCTEDSSAQTRVVSHLRETTSMMASAARRAAVKWVKS
jgi:hypothetical protein